EADLGPREANRRRSLSGHGEVPELFQRRRSVRALTAFNSQEANFAERLADAQHALRARSMSHSHGIGLRTWAVPWADSGSESEATERFSIKGVMEAKKAAEAAALAAAKEAERRKEAEIDKFIQLVSDQAEMAQEAELEAALARADVPTLPEISVELAEVQAVVAEASRCGGLQEEEAIPFVSKLHGQEAMSVSAMDGPALSGLDPAVSQSESRSDFYALEAAQEEFVHLAEPVQVQTRASLPPLERPAPVSWGEARLDKLDAVEAENCAADSHPQPRPSEAQVAAPEGQIEGLHIAAPNLVLGGALAQSEHLELRHGQNQVGQDGFSSILPEQDVPSVDSSSRAGACTVCTRALKVFCALASGRSSQVHRYAESDQEPEDCLPGPPAVPEACAVAWPTWPTVLASNASRSTLLGSASPPGKRRLKEHLHSDYVFKDEEQRAQQQMLQDALDASDALQDAADSPELAVPTPMPRGCRSPKSTGEEKVDASRSPSPKAKTAIAQSRSPSAAMKADAQSRSPSPAKAMIELPHRLESAAVELHRSQDQDARPRRGTAASFLHFQEPELPELEPPGRPTLLPTGSPRTRAGGKQGKPEDPWGKKADVNTGAISETEAPLSVRVRMARSNQRGGRKVFKEQFEKSLLSRRSPVKVTRRMGKHEWPDLCLASCVEGLDGQPAFHLGWGASDLPRHIAVGRLELQCVPLGQAEVGLAMHELRQWHTLQSSGIKVLYATGPSTLFARAERCVQRFAAHVGNAQTPARVYLTGMAAGDAVALRLRAWLRSENSWSAFGSVLVLVLPCAEPQVETGGCQRLLASLRATAHPGDA
ncbi:unnamed protein product, partial [Effrenium voratum]